MPWERRYFKGNKVFARVDDQGDLVDDGGRVDMRYSDSEDAKIYRAAARNISGPPGDGGRPKTGSRHQSNESSGTKSGPHQIKSTDSVEVTTDVPPELEGHPPPDDDVIEVYTDGACRRNPGPCGYGLLIRQGSTYREAHQFLGRGTNNIAELTAIKVAVEQIDQRSHPVRIYSDSRYAIGVLADGWKAKANRALILEIRQLLDEFDDCKLIKVKGHAGHPLNERADALATSSMDDI